mmetsp:Transcript_17099/g.54586  ORF Transcript_17099/g.54586 Transcript_17099/m.54586 type:complete len:117 (+) Transcript_17099:137-487(+)
MGEEVTPAAATGDGDSPRLPASRNRGGLSVDVSPGPLKYPRSKTPPLGHKAHRKRRGSIAAIVMSNASESKMKRLHDFFHDPDSSRAALMLHVAFMALIVFSVRTPPCSTDSTRRL